MTFRGRKVHTTGKAKILTGALVRPEPRSRDSLWIDARPGQISFAPLGATADLACTMLSAAMPQTSAALLWAR
jgi:hypothetical protein